MRIEQHSIGKEAAIELAETKWWEGKSAREIVAFQLFTLEMCMPFGEFHKAVEETLGRPVWTHEFADPDQLAEEFLGDRKAPTMQDITDMMFAFRIVPFALDVQPSILAPSKRIALGT